MFTTDLRQTLRKLAKRPGFTLTTVLILAVGIGATTSTFSMVNAIFLTQVPYPDPDELILVLTSRESEDSAVSQRSTVSYPDVRDWQERAESVESIAAFVNWPQLNLYGGEHPKRVRVSFATSEYFKLLEAKPIMGRTFSAEEDLTFGGSPVTVLSYRLWQEIFAGDADVIGKALNMGDQPYTVIGVLPQNFQHVSILDIDLWVPLAQASTHFGNNRLEGRQFRWLDTLARLKPGFTIQQAKEEFSAIGRNMAQEYPETNAGIGANVLSLKDRLFFYGELKNSIIMLTLGAIFVLLIGCANVATLLLVHAAEQREETAVCLALGASRGRVIRRFLVESLVLSVAGGAIGLILAIYCNKLMFTYSPLPIPQFAEITIDFRVLTMALLVSIATGVIFTVAPAWLSTKLNLHAMLKPGGKNSAASPGRSFGRRALIVVELALSVALLIGAGLLIRSFQNFQTTDIGFDSDRMLTMHFELSREKYSDRDARRAFYQEFSERIIALPGVQSAGLWGPDRPGSSFAYRSVIPEGRHIENLEDRVRNYEHRVGPHALKSLGLELLAGRYISTEDRVDSPLVAVLSRSAAEAMWPGLSPTEVIGKRFTRGTPGEDPWVTVVGVAKDAMHRGRDLLAHNPKDMYTSLVQMPIRRMSLFARADRDVESLIPEFRQAVQEVDSTLPVFDVASMEQRMHDEEDEIRFNTYFMIFFSLIAALLTAMGIYGTLAYSASRRTQEIGVRLAIGATRKDVFRLMTGQVAIDLLLGLALGAVGAYYLISFMSSMLFGVDAADPLVIVAIVVIVTLVTAIATFIPTRRALGISPVEALRYE